MKYISSQWAIFLKERGVKRNMGYFLRFLCLLFVMITTYSVLFHIIMNYEGQHYSWLTGLYWTLTVMTTLGFGDITFQSDLGRMFSVVVLVSGVICLLVMLPFAFIQYLYAPWLEAQKKKETPRILPETLSGHIILVGLGPITLNLAEDLARYGYYCALLCGDSQTALDLTDQGYHAVMGGYDDGETYRRLRVGNAAMLVAMDNDVRNTNIVFSAREVDRHVNIIARAEKTESIDILQLAGCSRVFQFRRLLGRALAARVTGGHNRSSVLAAFGPLVVAEAQAAGTSLAGKTLRDTDLRRRMGINVVGLWERGQFHLPKPDAVLSEHSVLVMAGTEEQMAAFDHLENSPSALHESRAIVLGGGRVGLSAARELCRRGINVVIVDKKPVTPDPVKANTDLGPASEIFTTFASPSSRPAAEATEFSESSGAPHYSPSALSADMLAADFLGPMTEQPANMEIMRGDAADIAVLEQAGIREASSVVITTHDDDTNIYLTIYCRRLRPDIQIVTRATLDRNVGILHAAGADVVLSLASMITNSIMNLLAPGKVFMLNEGLNIFRANVGQSLHNQNLAESGIRAETHCSLVAVHGTDDSMTVNPGPEFCLQHGQELYLIGDSHAEDAYYRRFGHDKID